MTESNEVQTLLDTSNELKFTSEHQEILLNNDELRTRNREQLIEKLERVIQEKNASIAKLEEREHYLEDTLQKRNTEFHILEDKLKEFEEKTYSFEQLHQLQVQTFEKTIRDCQIENERLCEHINDLTRELRGKTSFDVINQEKILTFDRISADIQLWREKLDSYKSTIEQREETISNLKKEINELHRKKQTNGDFEDNSFRLQISTLQNTLRDRDKEIEHLKVTLRRVRDTLQPGQLSHENRWRSCSDDIGRDASLPKPFQKKRSISPCIRDQSPPFDIECIKKKFNSLTDRLSHVQGLLVKRDDQIVTLKRVHDKRWLRLKHLQKQYRSLKDELQSYTDDDILQKKTRNDYFYRRAIHKTKNSCSVCNDHRWKKASGINKKLLKQEDDDHVWNEVTKLKRENGRLMNENLSLNEKTDLQEVEINEQRITIDDLQNEIQRLNQQPRSTSVITTNNDQKYLIEKLDKNLYELETERTNLIFEHERLKTNLDLCIVEKQDLIQQKTQLNTEVKKLKLRILALQDQIHKLKRENKKDLITTPPMLTTTRGRIIKKKPKKLLTTKSCLEVLLDQNTTIIDDPQNESLISNRRRHHSCSLCDHHNEHSFIRRKRQPSTSTIISKKKYGPLKRNSAPKSRLTIPSSYPNFTRKPSVPSSIPKPSTCRITPLRKRIEQLENELVNSREENEHLNQRLTTTLSRINVLKTTNQKLVTECDKFKTNHLHQSTFLSHDSTILDNSVNLDNLYERLKNTSFDAAQQRKLNKSLQTDNEILNKNIQSLTEKLTHTERDIASKRLLIENYKSRLSEMEINLNRSNEKYIHENDGERVKSLTEAAEKLRISIDSYKNRLQAITREKHDLETRYTELSDEHQKLKTRFEDLQSKFRLTDQQLRQLRINNEQLNQELVTSRCQSEEQLLTLNNKTQDSLKKITSELNRTLQRLNEYESFINALLHEMIQRSIQMSENLKRAREHQKQRESLSMSLPGYDTAMNTASKILNLTQDDLDEIMSMTDESFQINAKEISMDKNEKMRQKVSKLLLSQEACSAKLLKIFSKKLDEIQTVDRELAIIKNT